MEMLTLDFIPNEIADTDIILMSSELLLEYGACVGRMPHYLNPEVLGKRGNRASPMMPKRPMEAGKVVLSMMPIPRLREKRPIRSCDQKKSVVV